jgi:hypothetical protein
MQENLCSNELKHIVYPRAGSFSRTKEFQTIHIIEKEEKNNKQSKIV